MALYTAAMAFLSSIDEAPYSPKVRAALARARADAEAFERDPIAGLRASAAPFTGATRRVAMGDPQAPLPRVLEILDRHDLLSDDGRIHPGAQLVSMGDHFDWGAPDERTFAAESGYALLAWLAAHPRGQVSILTGNHDLARVGELVTYDDIRFQDARAEAVAIRRMHMGHPGRAERRHTFLTENAALPSVGVAVRDFSTFEARQRTLVEALLRGGRLRAALAVAPDFLLIHAAVTPEDLALVDYAGDAADAQAIATTIQEAFDDAAMAWDGEDAFGIPHLYRPGSYSKGESRGIFVQRPADPAVGELPLFEGPPRRRFDPRILAQGLTQATGHIRDQKCRDLMPVWADEGDGVSGPLRHLWTDGRRVIYKRGVPAPEGGAQLLFTDGGMNHADPADYELLDLDTRKAL